MKTSTTKQENSARFPASNMSAKLQEIVSRSNKVAQRVEKWSSGKPAKPKETTNPEPQKPEASSPKVPGSKSPSKQGNQSLMKMATI